jgi:hypothetical protein
LRRSVLRSGTRRRHGDDGQRNGGRQYDFIHDPTS